MIYSNLVRLAIELYFKVFFMVNEKIKDRFENIEDLAKFPSENPNPVLRVDKERVIYINKPGEVLFKVKKDNIIPALIQDIVNKTFNTNMAMKTEIELNSLIYSLDITPIKEKGYANIYGRDISERKKAEEEMRLQNEIMKNLAEGIYLIRISDLKIVWVNPRFEEMFGYNPGEMIGKVATIVNAPTDKSPDEIAEEIVGVLERTGEWHGEVHNMKKDGTLFWCYANVSVFNHPVYGEVLISVHSDITESKKVEKAMREAENARNERLTMLGQLAGGVGHELRNPLGAIKNASYFLNMVLEKPEPEIKETLEILEKEINTSEIIINSLLGFARPKLPLYQKVDINKLIQEVVSGTAVPENIEIINDLNNSLPIVLADPSQLTIVFGNIIRNAIQAITEGGRISIKTSFPNPEVVAIAIQDTGIGISQDNLRKLFEPLFTTKAKGIGLGLAISKLIVESHGGIIKAQSEEGKGSTFTIEIPIKGKKAI